MRRGVLAQAVTSGLLAGAVTLLACGDAGESGSSGGMGGDPSTSSSSSDAASSSTTQAASSSSIAAVSSSSGGTMFECDPPAAPGSIYELSDVPVFPPKEPVSMCQFRGDVMLIFNAAAV
ncbi:MAG: hypothetical protein KC731_26425 [Myxococcales bacterium]|nr:hypothetical protein [Myxococcales bacterium]